MKKYLLLLLSLSTLCGAAAGPLKTAGKSKISAAELEAWLATEADSLRQVADLRQSRIDSLEQALRTAHSAFATYVVRMEEEIVRREQAAAAQAQAQAQAQTAAQTAANRSSADSLAALQQRLQPKRIESTFETDGLTVLDTLDSGNEAIRVLLYSNNTWKYIRNRDVEVGRDRTIFEKFWSTESLFPYRDVDMSAMPKSVVIDLVDSTKSYHYPYRGTVHPHGKYGPRRNRQHQGVDLPLKEGEPIYATFCGRVRISTYNNGGYGNLIIIRHDNGLETYYGHLSERMVQAGQWVEAGQIIGKGGSTGRSTGPHLHFETRYYGQSFDPERLIDFKTGILCRETFLLKKSFFSIHSNAGQDFDDEIANEEDDKREAAEKTAIRYHKIRSGETLGAIAIKYGTTVKALCRLNNIQSPSHIRSGSTIRVR